MKNLSLLVLALLCLLSSCSKEKTQNYEFNTTELLELRYYDKTGKFTSDNVPDAYSVYLLDDIFSIKEPDFTSLKIKGDNVVTTSKNGENTYNIIENSDHLLIFEEQHSHRRDYQEDDYRYLITKVYKYQPSYSEFKQLGSIEREMWHKKDFYYVIKDGDKLIMPMMNIDHILIDGMFNAILSYNGVNNEIGNDFSSLSKEKMNLLVVQHYNLVFTTQ